MKSSTLHRSSLSREKMSMIENIRPQNYGSAPQDINQYMRFQKKPELDVLWRDFEKNVQSKSKTKAPVVYAGIGFVLGLLFALFIAVIIGISVYSDVSNSQLTQQRYNEESNSASVTVVPSANEETAKYEIIESEEKYTVKSGDTLDKIAFRFYGKYDPVKIEKIMQINNIKDVTTIQIGQVLIIPLN